MAIIYLPALSEDINFDAFDIIRMFRIGDRAQEVHPVILQVWISTAVAGEMFLGWDQPQPIQRHIDIGDGDRLNSNPNQFPMEIATANNTSQFSFALGIDITKNFAFFNVVGGGFELTIEYALADGGMDMRDVMGRLLPEIRQVEKVTVGGGVFHQPPVIRQVGNQGL